MWTGASLSPGAERGRRTEPAVPAAPFASDRPRSDPAAATPQRPRSDPEVSPSSSVTVTVRVWAPRGSAASTENAPLPSGLPLPRAPLMELSIATMSDSGPSSTSLASMLTVTGSPKGPCPPSRGAVKPQVGAEFEAPTRMVTDSVSDRPSVSVAVSARVYSPSVSWTTEVTLLSASGPSSAWSVSPPMPSSTDCSVDMSSISVTHDSKSMYRPA